MLPGYQCSSVFRAKSSLLTIDGERLPLNCNAPNQPTVANGTFLEENIVTSNGVLHVIDTLLLPPKAQSVVQATRNAGCLKFLELMELAGLNPQLVAFGPYTIFAPNDEAMEREASRISLLKQDPDQLSCFLLQHMTEGSHSSNSLRDHEVLVPLSEAPASLVTLRPLRCNQTKWWLRIRVYRGNVTVEDTVILKRDQEAFNGWVHTIGHLISVPEENLATAVVAYQNTTRFNALLQKAGLEFWQRLLDGPDQWTIVLVSDGDMERWSEDTFTYYRILKDPHVLQQTLMSHILPGIWLPQGLPEGSHWVISPQYPDGRSHTIPLHFDPASPLWGPLTLSKVGGALSLSHASLHPFYKLCSNGVIYFSDSLLIPR